MEENVSNGLKIRLRTERQSRSVHLSERSLCILRKFVVQPGDVCGFWAKFVCGQPQHDQSSNEMPRQRAANSSEDSSGNGDQCAPLGSAPHREVHFLCLIDKRGLSLARVFSSVSCYLSIYSLLLNCLGG